MQTVRLVPSANSICVITVDTLHVIKYRLNKIGPSMEPCGTPHVIYFGKLNLCHS